jgi:hypothetical protein
MKPLREEGIGPTKEFPPRSRNERVVRVESVEGIVPVKRLEARDSPDNLKKFPRKVGIGPTRESYCKQRNE